MNNNTPYNILSSKYSLLFFIIIAFIYNVIVYKNSVILTIMFFIIIYIFNLYNIKEKINNKLFKTDEEVKKKFINDVVEEDISYHKNKRFYLNNPNIYKIYKKPRDFYFLKNNEFFEEIIFNLRFVEKYDKGDFLRMITLMDAFLKTYYYIINDKYDYSYIDILVDIRLELLNTINNFMIDAPMFSKDKNKRLDKIIHKNQLKVQSYTYKKLKNLSNKFPQFKPNNPKGINDVTINDNYNVII